jgi:hypothetical protein
MEKLRGFAGADSHRVKQLTRAPRQGLAVVPITPTLPIIPTLRMWRSNYRACCVPPSESRLVARRPSVKRVPIEPIRLYLFGTRISVQ